MDDYVKNYCSYGAKIFLIKKIKWKILVINLIYDKIVLYE
jgi:uncharacterized protein YutD